MTIQDVTEAMLDALAKEDLEGLAATLETRGRLLEQGSRCSQEDLEAGERVCHGIEQLKKRWAAENARLGQLQEGFSRPAAAAGPSVVDLLG